MNHVIMYHPIDREMLEDLFQSAFVAQSFTKINDNAFSIELPDRDLPRLKRFSVAHTIIKYMDVQKIKDKIQSVGSLIF